MPFKWNVVTNLMRHLLCSCWDMDTFLVCFVLFMGFYMISWWIKLILMSWFDDAALMNESPYYGSRLFALKVLLMYTSTDLSWKLLIDYPWMPEIADFQRSNIFQCIFRRVFSNLFDHKKINLTTSSTTKFIFWQSFNILVQAYKIQ